jgi:uncharacterized membrane protein HdeD (DUF308 family)
MTRPAKEDRHVVGIVSDSHRSWILHGGVRMPAGWVAGGLAMLAGAAMLAWPAATEMVLLALIALRAAVIGVAELLLATHIDRHAPGAWLVASMGLISIVVAGLLLANPAAGLLVIVRAFGLYAVVIGLLTVAQAWVMESRYA